MLWLGTTLQTTEITPVFWPNPDWIQRWATYSSCVKQIRLGLARGAASQTGHKGEHPWELMVFPGVKKQNVP